jgi:hypothetical protein
MSAGTLFRRAAIEEVFVINLPRRLDRRLRTARELKRHDIQYRIVQAVDGKCDALAQRQFQEFLDRPGGLTTSSAHASPSKRESIKHNASPEAFAYSQTMLGIFSAAQRERLERIAILDDDVLFADALDEASLAFGDGVLAQDTWKVALLGASEYSTPHPAHISTDTVQGHYHPVPGYTCGSFAGLYSASVFDQIINGLREADGAFDNTVLGSVYAQHRDQCYVAYPNLCYPDVESTDMRSARDQQTHSERMRWPYSHLAFARYKKSVSCNVLRREPVTHPASESEPAQAFTGVEMRNFWLSGDSSSSLQVVDSWRDVVCPARSLRSFDELLRAERRGLPCCGIDLPDADFTLLWPHHPAVDPKALAKAVLGRFYGDRIERDPFFESALLFAAPSGP